MNRNFHDMPISQEGWEYIQMMRERDMGEAEEWRENIAGATIAGFAILAATLMLGFIAGVIFMVVVV